MKVALIGLAPLQSLGLKEILNIIRPDVEVTILQETAADMPVGADRFIVSSAAMAAFARFLMPRLSEVLLLTSSRPLSDNENSLPCLSPLASQTEISQALSNLLTERNRTEFRHPHAHRLPEPEPFRLTSRELDVLREIVQGHSVKEIAVKLGISVNTVLTHRKNLAEKTGVHSAPALVYFAMRHKLV